MQGNNFFFLSSLNTFISAISKQDFGPFENQKSGGH